MPDTDLKYQIRMREALDAYLFGPYRLVEETERLGGQNRSRSRKCDGGKTKPMGKLWGIGCNSELDVRKSYSCTCYYLIHNLPR